VTYVVNRDPLHLFLQELVERLAPSDRFFRFADELVHIGPRGPKRVTGRSAQGLVAAHIEIRCVRKGSIERPEERLLRCGTLPRDIAEAFCHCPELSGFSELAGYTRVPCFDHQWRLVGSPGFHTASGLYYDGPAIVPVPLQPSPMGECSALEPLLDRTPGARRDDRLRVLLQLTERLLFQPRSCADEVSATWDGVSRPTGLIQRTAFRTGRPSPRMFHPTHHDGLGDPDRLELLGDLVGVIQGWLEAGRPGGPAVGDTSVHAAESAALAILRFHGLQVSPAPPIRQDPADADLDRLLEAALVHAESGPATAATWVERLEASGHANLLRSPLGDRTARGKATWLGKVFGARIGMPLEVSNGRFELVRHFPRGAQGKPLYEFIQSRRSVDGV